MTFININNNNNAQATVSLSATPPNVGKSDGEHCASPSGVCAMSPDLFDSPLGGGGVSSSEDLNNTKLLLGHCEQSARYLCISEAAVQSFTADILSNTASHVGSCGP